MKISESEQKSNAFMEFAAALKPYGPWSYLVVGMLVCATILMFCLAWGKLFQNIFGYIYTFISWYLVEMVLDNFTFRTALAKRGVMTIPPHDFIIAAAGLWDRVMSG